MSWSNVPEPARGESLAIELEDVWFHYLTPVKVPLLPKLRLPLRRVALQRHVALKGVSLGIRPGRITALLGRNGSGKTTLIRLATGARLPSAGTVRVFGQSPWLHRHELGLCLGNSLVYHRLTAWENLEYFGKLYGVPRLKDRIEELSELLGLTSHLHKMVESYSFGMKAKLALARAMVHSPRILILDEPTLGIDIELALQIRRFIRSLTCTVLLTTHYMEEAETLADDLCLIDSGTILACGERGEVLRKFAAGSVPELLTSSLNSESLKEASA